MNDKKWIEKSGHAFKLYAQILNEGYRIHIDMNGMDIATTLMERAEVRC